MMNTYLSTLDEPTHIYFVSHIFAGTAAGVSAAFLSPIGGILFAAEEGASYLTARLMTQCFAAAITVIIFEYLFDIFGDGAAEGFSLSQPFALRLQRFNGLPGQKGHLDPGFAFYDYFVIAFVGVVGGMVGACFVEISKKLTKLRQKHTKTRLKKFVEVVILAVLATTLMAWLPKVPGLSRCQSLNNTLADEVYFVQFNCGANEYNDLATLLRNPLPAGINLLFWEPSDAFSAISCFVSGVTLLSVLLVTFGASIAMGIFVPLLYIGAAFGRFFAVIVPNQLLDVRTYAIVGSAASLNGVSKSVVLYVVFAWVFV